MRYLRFWTVVLFVISVIFTLCAGVHYSSNTNSDVPVLTNQYPELKLSVNDPPETLLKGLSAYDETDGDLTDRILVASVSHFLEGSTVRVKYVVFDSHNNSATATRRVTYTDYQSPRFSLTKPPVYVRGEPFDLLDYLKVTDDLDGDISDRIRIVSNAVSNYNTGMYPVIAEVSNSCGDTAQLTIWVSYLEKPNTAHITLHDYILYIHAGDAFDPWDYIASIYDGERNPLDASNVRIKGNLDVQTPGCYQMIYTYSDSELQGQADMIVVVLEQEA